jgi:hypothetical protein
MAKNLLDKVRETLQGVGSGISQTASSFPQIQIPQITAPKLPSFQNLGNSLQQKAQLTANYFNPNVGVFQKSLSQAPTYRNFWTDIPQVSIPKKIQQAPRSVGNYFGNIARVSQQDIRNIPSKIAAPFEFIGGMQQGYNPFNYPQQEVKNPSKAFTAGKNLIQSGPGQLFAAISEPGLNAEVKGLGVLATPVVARISSKLNVGNLKKGYGELQIAKSGLDQWKNLNPDQQVKLLERVNNVLTKVIGGSAKEWNKLALSKPSEYLQMANRNIGDALYLVEHPEDATAFGLTTRQIKAPLNQGAKPTVFSNQVSPQSTKLGQAGLQKTKEALVPPLKDIVPQDNFSATQEYNQLLKTVNEVKTQNKVVRELANQTKETLGRSGLDLVNQLKGLARRKEFAEGGDVETLRRMNPKLVDRALEAVREANPRLVGADDNAILDFVLQKKQTAIPIKADIQRLKELKDIAKSEQDLWSQEFGRRATKQELDKLFTEADQSLYQPVRGVYSAVPQSKTITKTAQTTAQNAEIAAKAEFTQWQKAFNEQTGAVKAKVGDITGAIKKTTSPISNPEGLKDIAGFKIHARDMFRNFKEVYGDRFDEVKKAVLDPFDASKGKLIDSYNGWIKRIGTEIEGNLGIKKGSAESAAVQEFGEKKINQLDLIEEFGQQKAENIIKADAWFRKEYDKLLDEVNQIRAAIYPNQPDKIIPKRADYYRHFREMSDGIAGLLNLFETPAGISSKLAGISYQTEPKAKWLSFAQKRLGDKSDIDAVGGFLDYIKAAEYAKNIDPHTARFRALADELAQNTAEGPTAGKLNNFVLGLNRYADDLAGKTNPMDRFIQEVIPGGRTGMGVLNWVNSRVKANVILGNLSSAIAQAGNVPQGIASAGVTNVPKGISRTLGGIFSPNNPMSKSSFIKERYFRGFDTFDRGVIDNAKKGAAWVTQILDEIGTKFIWNMHYNKAKGMNIPDAVKYADDATRALVAGRGIGEVPLIQKSKLFQLAAPFQLEVGNLWWVMKDQVDAKQFGQLAKLVVASYLFNRVAENIRGSDVVFDPIQATKEGIDAFNEEEDKTRGALRFGGRIAGEVLGNVPLGQSVASVYPEYGATVGDYKLPTRKEFFGKGDPTRFGSGLLASQGITDPLFKLVPPFGGQQIKKTLGGIKAQAQGYSGSPDKVRFPIEQNIPNLIKNVAFGEYSTPEAREYFNKNRRPLGEKQSELFKQDRSMYTKIIDAREQNSKVEKAKEDIKKESGGSKTVGDKVVYWDSDAGEVKTISLKTLDQKVADQKYSLEADRLKRSNDTQEWLKLTQNYIDALKARQGELDPKLEADKVLSFQNKIEDLQAQVTKYKSYGGFKKGKKITLKQIKMPRVKTAKLKFSSVRRANKTSKKLKLKDLFPYKKRQKVV